MPLCGLKSVMSVPFSVHIALTIVLSSCKCAGFVEVKKKKNVQAVCVYPNKLDGSVRLNPQTLRCLIY